MASSSCAAAFAPSVRPTSQINTPCHTGHTGNRANCSMRRIPRLDVFCGAERLLHSSWTKLVLSCGGTSLTGAEAVVGSDWDAASEEDTILATILTCCCSMNRFCLLLLFLVVLKPGACVHNKAWKINHSATAEGQLPIFFIFMILCCVWQCRSWITITVRRTVVCTCTYGS